METKIIREINFEKIKKSVNESSNEKKIFTSNDDELNRKVLEKLGDKVDVLLLNASSSSRNDKMKQRDSGFNHVLAKIAKKENVVIGINFDEIVEAKDLNEKSKILARVRQNIKLCNKNKLKMEFVVLRKENERNIYDLKALGSVLGMPTDMVRDL